MGDIRRKLQKLRGTDGRNLETLWDEVWRVFSNREEGYKQGMRKLVAVLLSSVGVKGSIKASYSSRLDLKDTPLDDAETWFTDASSYVISGKRHAGYAEILRLLEAVQLPEQVAIMHVKAYQKVSSELEEGNELADREAKEAAKGEITIEGALIPNGQVSLEALGTSHQLIRTNYTMHHKLSPAPIGMNLTLVRQIMKHQDLAEILKKIQEKGQKTLVIVYHDIKRDKQSITKE
ncbi:hypothetical protein DUI87_29434 [Hirundo rustica rustica]|uniref:Uncharacterized protein n=1 Tax=Hirundo rustica rustica TaxID=333673 RepID=A0A3M0J768_HIRRU|nr:hypothetical protein DUI87_29434 [Hirundo rustica rustica]